MYPVPPAPRSIRDAGMAMMCGALRVNTTLLRLDMAFNNCGFASGVQLGVMLGDNRGLTYLDGTCGWHQGPSL